MNSAEEWVQRVDTPARMFQRLADGYGISLMFGERFHQFIRNSRNWRGSSGMMLDIDLFKDESHPEAPEPCTSQAELFDRFPLIPRLCSYLMPSASSLHEGRPFKARGIVLFPEPVTDQRIYRAFGDLLLQTLDCIPANVTKNPGRGRVWQHPQRTASLHQPRPRYAMDSRHTEPRHEKVFCRKQAKKRHGKRNGHHNPRPPARETPRAPPSGTVPAASKARISASLSGTVTLSRRWWARDG